MSASGTHAATPRHALLSRLAEARNRDPLRADLRVVNGLRDELSMPVRGMLGYTAAIDHEAADHSEPLVQGVRRIQHALTLVVSLVDEVLDMRRVPAGKYGDEWEAVGLRMRAYLRPPVAAALAYVDLLVEDPSSLGKDRLVNDLYQVRAAGQYVQELVDDVAAVLELLAGEGSTAGVSPEVREVVEKHRSPLRHRRGPDAAAGHVLVVDDSQVNRDLLDRLLGRLGYRVTLAESGLHGLALLRTNHVDLVLLDIIMPEVDGFQVLHQMKVDEVLRHVPVIMISALDEVESVGRCIEMGAEDYLTKPFDPVILKARIGATLEKKRLRDLVDPRPGAAAP
jgi:CheY-like chemotaxis protein